MVVIFLMEFGLAVETNIVKKDRVGAFLNIVKVRIEVLCHGRLLS